MNQPFNWEKNTVPSHRIVVKTHNGLKSFLKRHLYSDISLYFLLNQWTVEGYFYNWQCCLAGSSKTAPRIFIFSNVLGAKNLSYVKSIETHARAFLTLNILSIGTVAQYTCFLPRLSKWKRMYHYLHKISWELTVLSDIYILWYISSLPLNCPYQWGSWSLSRD